jgi:hypothetical protein
MTKRVKGKPIGHRPGLPFGVDRRGERGSSLIIALAVTLLLSVIAAAVLTYAQAAYVGASAYREQRDERYAGDGAISAAVNYARGDGTLAVDPDLSSTQCRYYTPSDVGTVTVSCAADAGSGSGAPEDVGLVPPEALVLLGTRHTQPGVYNAPNCGGWWDGIVDFFSVGVNPEDTGPAEYSGWFAKRYGVGLLGFQCNQVRTRPNEDLSVRGNFYAAGVLRAENNLDVGMTDGTMWARAGCQGSLASNCSATVPANRTAMPYQAHLAGTRPDTDPGRTAPNTAVTDQPITSAGQLDVASAWQPVGFGTDGTPQSLGYAMPMAGSNQTTMPERTTAYTWNSATNVFTAQATCPNNSATIVFLPGWYRSAEVLSRYTTANACRDVNFWFAPNPGPDGVLLTEDDVTGAYYFDFTTAHTRRCGPPGDNGQAAPAVTGRWCVGGSSSQNARVVGGTPLNWSPVGDYTAGGGGNPPTVRTVIDTANTVDLDLSQRWVPSSNPATSARRIDNTAALYQANFCIIFIGCLAQDRAIRVRDLTPRVTSPPLAQSGAPNGRVYLTVNYAVENPQSVLPAEAVIEAVSDVSGRHQCGTYTLYGNAGASAPYNDRNNAGGNASNLHSYTFTDNQATQLANNCGSLDRLNGLEIKLQVRGNTRNQPRANWWFDGVRVEFDTTPSASFPEPVNGSSEPAAQSDCDPGEAGAQFIFGGASHVYVADGSLEVCAGPHPTAAAEKQSIGLWALPPVPEVAPTGIGATYGDDLDSLCVAGPAASQAAAVAEIDGYRSGSACGQADRNSLVINYSGFCICTVEAGVDINMAGYTPPAGYRIARVDARISYNPKNSCTWLFQCPGADPRMEPRVGATSPCGSMNMPKNPDRGPLQFNTASITNLVMYDGSRNCVGVTSGGASLPAGAVRWWARGDCVLFGCNYNDTLDGIKYQITLEPTTSSTARIKPQSGCNVAQPNYNAGYGVPDCAVVRADTGDFGDNWSLPWTTKEGQWRGRFSVKGTVWAPGSAIEIDDSDVAYPLATRGAVLRHLRVSGWGPRTGYNEPAFDNVLDLTPAAREGTFVACLQSESRRTSGAACDAAQDRVLSSARVLFAPSPAPGGSGTDFVWDPDVQWWTNKR